MSDATPDRAWAGRVTFARSTAELRSTTVCPACLIPLSSMVCSSCGLDLRHPASTELAAASAAIADALDARLDLIGRIRRETAAAAIAGPSASASPRVAAAPAVQLPANPASPAASGGPRRSGIQIALIVVGISLLAVFAVFGLVYAFVTFGSVVRMAIIVAGTLATMIAAAVLARRGLTSTAEGLAALGTVMLVLDAWALRLNDPVGLGSSPAVLYWGVALLIVGAVATLWSRANHLATPGVVAAGLLPIGAGLTTAHLVGELLPATFGAATTAGAIAVLATAAVSWGVVTGQTAVPRRVAQLVALTAGAVAATVALASLVDFDSGALFSPAIAGLALAAAALLHVVTLAPGVSRTRATVAPRLRDTLVLCALGAGAAIAVIVAGIITAARFDQEWVIVSVAPVAATAVAVLVEQGWRRSAPDSVWRTTFVSATITAAALASIAGGLAAIVASSALVEAGTRGVEGVVLSIADPVSSHDPATVAALGALGLALGLVALSWATLGVLVRRARWVTLIAGIVLVAAVPLLPAWWLVMVVFAVLAVGGAVGLLGARRVSAPDARRALVALCIPLSTGAAFGAFLTGWGVSRGWVVGLIVALLTIAVARTATAVLPLRAAFMAVATALLLGSMPELATDLALALPAVPFSVGSVVIAGAAVVIASSHLGRLAAVERYAVGAVALAATLIAAGFAAYPGGDEAAALGLLTAALALVAVRGTTVERLIARGLLPLAVARAAVLGLSSDPAATVIGDPALIAVVAVGAVIVVAMVGLLTANGLTASDRAAAARVRSARSTITDAGFGRVVGDLAAAVAAVALVISAAANTPAESLLWLTVLALAVLALVIAISRDGLIGSASPRRFVGWAALAVATIALWMRLADAGTTAPEPYVLPLAGAMILVVAASAILSRRRGESSPRSAAPLTAAALLIALVPSAVQSAATIDARSVVVTLVAVALITAPLLAARRIDAALSGMTAALVGSGLATLALLALTHTLDLVITSGGAGLDGAGLDGAGLDGAGLDGAGLTRGTLVVTVTSVVAVISRLLAEGRLRDIAPAATAGVAALCAAALGLSGAIDPVELVSVPLALALLAIGTLHLEAEPRARSWLWLGPAFIALLVPSLLAVDDTAEPLWRVVAVGVAAASVFIAGLWRQLQAPFVIGGTVLLIHLLVQAWPLLQQVGNAVEWWLWLGLAGVLVVVIAARYERRLQTVRDIATRIAQLR